MARYHAQVIIRSLTGASRDDWVNTFAAGQIGELDLTDATAWVAAIDAFYEACKSNGAMRGRAQSGHLVKIYDISQPAPNYPVFELPWAFNTANGSVDLPDEVNLCVSYSNTFAVTIPRARRRGRIYIGGWQEDKNTTGRPTGPTCQQLADDYLAYVQAFNAIGTLEASVWSRVEDSTYPVDTVWVDNEWDTMRSRGGRATVRYTETLP